MVTYEISKEHNNYPNLTVYETLSDGVLAGWRVNADEGYVFYDTNDEHLETDEGEQEKPVIYYSAECYFPRTLDWNTFGLVAVLQSSIEDTNIHGDNASNTKKG